MFHYNKEASSFYYVVFFSVPTHLPNTEFYKKNFLPYYYKPM